MEQVDTVKNDGESDEKYDENFSIFWLGFQILMTLKSISLKPFISAPGGLIDKRGLICDHSQFVNICLLFGKYLLLISTAIDFRNFKL